MVYKSNTISSACVLALSVKPVSEVAGVNLMWRAGRLARNPNSLETSQYSHFFFFIKIGLTRRILFNSSLVCLAVLKRFHRCDMRIKRSSLGVA